MFQDFASQRAAAAQEEIRRRGPIPPGSVDAVSDYTLSRPMHALDLARGMRILGGRVVDNVGLVHNYRVALDFAGGVVRGILGSAGSMGLVGARSTATLPAGTRVIVCWTPGAPECYILSSLPDYGLSGADRLSDVIVPGSNTGMQVDAYLQGPFLLSGVSTSGPDKTGIADASADRPTDSLMGGEWGQVTETGTGLHLDPYLAYLRVNEETGVFAFYQDDLLRVTGHNLQLGSAGQWREDSNDGGYLSSEELTAVRDYEAAGQLVPEIDGGDPSYRQLSAEEVQLETPWYYYLEPAFDDQQGFYRLRRFRGAIGMGEKFQVVGPPPGRPGPYRHLVPEKLPGLYDSQVFLSGRQLTRSAKGIILAKTRPFAVPWRKRPAMTGQGRRGIDAPAAELNRGDGAPVTPSVRTSTLIDQIVYSGNYEGSHPFLDADSSWYLPEESDMDFLEPVETPDFYLLRVQQLLPTPDPVNLEIGGGYGVGQYFPNQAAISLLDDGSILMVDGWGSEYRMSQGSITEQCSGDIWKLPGRNANTWAGQDVIMRARNSADITAGQADVRIKAQNNLMLLGGNEVCGGILLESRTPSPVYDFDGKVGEDVVTTGIVLKSPNGQIAALGRDVVLSSDLLAYTHQPRAGLTGATTSGLVVFDTGGGRMITYARSCERRIGSTGTPGYALDEVVGASTTSFVETTSRGVLVKGELAVAGPALVRDCLTVGDWIIVSSAHIATASAGSWLGKVAAIKPAALSVAGAAMSRLSTQASTVTSYLASTATQGQDDYADCANGDITTVEFSLRDDVQYGTSSGLLIPEGRWQQMARQAGQILPTWTEPAVNTLGGGATRPHPGTVAWATASSGQRVNLSLFSDANGTAVDRADPDGVPTTAYAADGIAAETLYVLDTNFTVALP
jgi:hypothetical protein